MKRPKAQTLALCLLAAAAVCNAQTVRKVPEYYSSISSAIAVAQDGDTISVWGPPPGGPPEPPYVYKENIDYGGKAITVINRSFMPDWPESGHWCAPSWDSVVIDGERGTNTSTVTITFVQDGVATLRGFTIENGSGPYGGGVDCVYSIARLIRNKVIDNSASVSGGGIYLQGAWFTYVVADSNYVSDNDCEGDGGGIALHDVGYDSTLVRGNVVESNTADGYGGGASIQLFWGYFPIESRVLAGNTVSHNTGTIRGGGIYSQCWPFAARNNVIMNNSPDGVYATYTSGSEPDEFYDAMDLGTAEDPGYNVLMDNVNFDLTLCPGLRQFPA